MTRGFYDRLGVDPGASTGEMRAAYHEVVAGLVRRRKAILDQGGDPSAIDLARTQADEAWEILADPPRRRRYDAMLALVDVAAVSDPDELWRRVQGGLVHPAAAAAAELLRVGTMLKIGALPPAPTVGEPPVRRRAPDEEPTVVDGYTDPADAPTVHAGQVVPLHAARDAGPDRTLRVVDGTPSASTVLVMPERPSLAGEPPSVGSIPLAAVPRPGAPLDAIESLLDAHGYSGAFLRGARTHRGLTLEDLADTTRISKKYLEAIEADDFDRLPSPTFVRGYLREIARLLDLDVDEVVGGYMRRMTGK